MWRRQPLTFLPCALSETSHDGDGTSQRSKQSSFAEQQDNGAEQRSIGAKQFCTTRVASALIHTLLHKIRRPLLWPTHSEDGTGVVYNYPKGKLFIPKMWIGRVWGWCLPSNCSQQKKRLPPFASRRRFLKGYNQPGLLYG